uniref:Uncharacterized protein n=1 Tax=Rhizophora mucronata TaxID=61149 RepID=A0A2P2Q3X0_RHIMU
MSCFPYVNVQTRGVKTVQSKNRVCIHRVVGRVDYSDAMK